MGAGRRLLAGPLCGVAVWALALPGAGQTSEPATRPTEWELPADVRAALAATQDLAFNFDQPGFYAVLDFVKHSPRSPGTTQPPLEVTDWRDLLERPGEFRGRPVTVSGVVGRNKAPYALPARPEVGQLWQLELQRSDQPLTCTLILTESAADIPLGATLGVTGYFVMTRSYHGASGRVQQAALIIAPGPTAIERVAPRVAANMLDWRWIVGAIVVALAVTIVLLRWTRGQRHEYATPHARHEAPMNLADELAAWAEREGPAPSVDDEARGERHDH